MTTTKEYRFETVFVNKRGEIIETRKCEAYYYDESLEVNNDASQNLKMIYIPEGQFWMGSPEDEEDRYDDENPQHKVTVSSFFMSETPITEGQWRFVVTLPQEQIKLNPNPSSDGDDHPIVSIRWQEAMEFCARLSRYTGRNYRLPSEAEWEYACRAGTTTPFYFGETITGELANHDSNTTTPVGQFPPNAFGLRDMHGNIWEWCLDPWHNNYEDAPNDGQVWDEGKEDLYQDISKNLDVLLEDNRNHVIRGGSWAYLPGHCRSAYRDSVDDRSSDYGFRVVCVPPRNPLPFG